MGCGRQCRGMARPVKRLGAVYPALSIILLGERSESPQTKAMLTLVYDRDRLEPAELPPPGGALALLPGPVLWVSADGRVVDANGAAMDLLLDIGDASLPLHNAILETLRDQAARQICLTLKGDMYAFQVAMSATVAEPHGLCAIVVGQRADAGA